MQRKAVARAASNVQMQTDRAKCRMQNLQSFHVTQLQVAKCLGSTSAIIELNGGTHTLPTNCSCAIKGKTMSPVRRRSHEGATEMHITRS